MASRRTEMWQKLTRELDTLVEEGQVKGEIRDHLLAACRPRSRSLDSGRFVFFALIALGVVMLGLAAFLLLGFNWKFLSPECKLTVVLGSMLLTSLAAFWGRLREKRIFSEVFFFAVAILFGVGIWQIAQIYNLPTNYHEGMWLWAVGSLLISLWMRTPLVHCLTFLLLAIWVVMKTTQYSSWGNYEEIQEFSEGLQLGSAACGVSLPLLVLTGLIWSRLHGSRLVAGLNLVLLWWWGLFQITAWQMGALSTTFLAVWGGLFCLLGLSLVRDRCISGLLTVLGLPLVGLTLLIFSFYEWHQYAETSCGTHAVLIFILVLAVVLLSLAGWLFGRERNSPRPAGSWLDQRLVPTLLAGLMALLINLTALLVLHQAVDRPLLDDMVVLPLTIVGNLFMLTLAGWMLHYGQRHSAVWYWLGILYFLLWAFVRYMDLFGDAGGMLGASALFAAMAVLLFTAAWFRRYTQAAMATAPEPEPESDLFPPTEPGPPRTAWLAGSVLLLFVILGSMVADNTIPFRNAKTIVVETMPVDPRDLLRGDYVILRYPFSTTSGRRWNGNQDEKMFVVPEQPRTGQQVYAILEYDKEESVWKTIRISLEPPGPGQVYLRGIQRSYWQAQYGIESWYVQEGTGKALERAMRSGSAGTSQVRVELLVTPEGRSRINNVWIENVPPAKSADSDKATAAAPDA
ncbi:MAG: GDYXXLXY domain-containing protein [Planctomycetia bacterium]|nr:GDYXXLXY domain-containing protein [Planctomycetia bacterium]